MHIPRFSNVIQHACRKSAHGKQKSRPLSDVRTALCMNQRDRIIQLRKYKCHEKYDCRRCINRCGEISGKSGKQNK